MIFRISYCLFLLFVCFFVSPLSAQQLTDIPGGDITLSGTDYDYLRGLRTDVHYNSGKVVYVWEEYEDGERWVEAVVFDKNMNPENAYRINQQTVTAGGSSSRLFARVKVCQESNFFVVTWRSDHSGTWKAYAKKIRLDVGNTAYTPKDSADIHMALPVSGALYYPRAITFSYERNEILLGYYVANSGSPQNRRAYLRRFDYDLEPLQGSAGDARLINDNPGNDVRVLKQIKVLPVSQDLLMLSQDKPSGGAYDVHKRIFDYNTSTSQYDEVTSGYPVVNDHTADNQNHPQAVANPNTGDYTIMWLSPNGQDGSGNGSYAKIFDKDHNLLKGAFRIHQNSQHNQREPDAFWDPLSNHLVYCWHHSQSGIATKRYRVFDQNYNAITGDESMLTDASGNEKDIGGAYKGMHDVVFNSANRKVYYGYAHYADFMSNDSRTYARRYGFYHPLEDVQGYFSLHKRQQPTMIDVSQNSLKFKYEEEYKKQRMLTYKLYDEVMQPVSGTPQLEVEQGLNWLSIDLSGLGFQYNDTGMLEVTDARGNTKTLKFRYTGQ